MASSLYGLFGFLAVLVGGLDLVSTCLLFGSAAFTLAIALPVGLESSILDRTVALVRIAAICAAASTAAGAFIGIAILNSSLALSWTQIAGAQFVMAATIKILCAIAIAATVSPGRLSVPAMRALLVALCVVMLACQLATTHAAARPGERLGPLLLTGLHVTGAALWLGGLPCFWFTLNRAQERTVLARAGHRYSAMAALGVALVATGALGIALVFIGSMAALYGTSYGVMAATKVVLLVLLGLLGMGNFVAVRRLSRDPNALLRLKRFVEVEMGVGIAVLLLAASINTAPPAIDVQSDRPTLEDIADHFMPRQPRFDRPSRASLAKSLAYTTASENAPSYRSGDAPGDEPPPRNENDIVWSESNHHWSGVLVVLIGVAALLARVPPLRGARHWPLLFLLLAVFLLASDPDEWPFGHASFLESLIDPETIQHRVFVLLIVAFALFEWAVRTGRLSSPRLALVFPILMAVSGTLLLTHSHDIGDVRALLLIDYSHVSIGVLGIVAGWTRWLEVRAADTEARWAGWVWPLCFVLIGALLLDYREA